MSHFCAVQISFEFLTIGTIYSEQLLLIIFSRIKRQIFNSRSINLMTSKSIFRPVPIKIVILRVACNLDPPLRTARHAALWFSEPLYVSIVFNKTRPRANRPEGNNRPVYNRVCDVTCVSVYGNGRSTWKKFSWRLPWPRNLSSRAALLSACYFTQRAKIYRPTCVRLQQRRETEQFEIKLLRVIDYLGRAEHLRKDTNFFPLPAE
jgi:hypothetical protein